MDVTCTRKSYRRTTFTHIRPIFFYDFRAIINAVTSDPNIYFSIFPSDITDIICSFREEREPTVEEHKDWLNRVVPNTDRARRFVSGDSNSKHITNKNIYVYLSDLQLAIDGNYINHIKMSLVHNVLIDWSSVHFFPAIFVDLLPYIKDRYMKGDMEFHYLVHYSHRLVFFELITVYEQLRAFVVSNPRMLRHKTRVRYYCPFCAQRDYRWQDNHSAVDALTYCTEKQTQFLMELFFGN